ncbi:MAG TPA: DUF2185 domain-containing protein [Hyphomonadaceae bacterium]|nr:DUF2185 domain-containing protein [Hyphomonadaceae bacterium]
MPKKYKLPAADIIPLATGRGACIATDMITVRGKPVGFMYRQEQPDNEQDSGWRFLSGLEDQDYMDDAGNHGVYDVNTIANYDPTIIPLLDSPPGSVFERTPGAKAFREVVDWEPPED